MLEPTPSGLSSLPIVATLPFGGFDAARKNVVIVEDDVPLARFLCRELQMHQCSVAITQDAEETIQDLTQAPCDLLIIDLNVATMDGMETLARLRSLQPHIPILVLTARNHAEDRIQALRLGADDCLSKPFSYKELLARLNRLLRRDFSPVATSRISDLSVNREERRVMRGARKIDLTPREFAILEYLMDNAGKPVSRMALMRDVWNLPFDATTNIVDVYMKYLRDKIDQEGLPKLIQTVRGIGYVLGRD